MNPRDDPEIQMLVQQSQAGSIIGRGGSKIKSLREVCIVHVRITEPSKVYFINRDVFVCF